MRRSERPVCPFWGLGCSSTSRAPGDVPCVMCTSMSGPLRPRGLTPRRDAGLYAYERVLERAGLGPVAGVDEAGRGACAGPLVVAAAVLGPYRRGRLEGLADSKLLTAARRESLYAEITAIAPAWSALIVSREEIDRVGLHRCNIAGMRRALAGLNVDPGYVLTDGFRVPGLVTPGLPVPKGDRVAACVAAASIIAKVTRDRIMTELHEDYPAVRLRRTQGICDPCARRRARSARSLPRTPPFVRQRGPRQGRGNWTRGADREIY